MSTTAERMKAMRERRRAQGLRELRIMIPDARDPAFRQKVAAEVACLSPAAEEEAMAFIESLGWPDEDDAPR